MRTLAVGLLAIVVVAGTACVGSAEAADDASLISDDIFDPSIIVSQAPRSADARAAASVTGFVITPTFDTSITNDPNAVTIMSTINAAIAVYEASFSDPITVSIKFRKMSTGLGLSSTFFANVSYTNYLTALTANGTTADDATALSGLSPGPNNPVNGNVNMAVKLANLRALGFVANPPAGQPDSTISLHTSICNLDRSSTTNHCKYDLMAVVLHEIDEALGLGSALPKGLTSPVLPEDLFRYDQTGSRSFNTTPTSQAFFSIDSTTQLAQFNQTSGGDFGDWFSVGPHTPQVQDAFATAAAAPNLDVELRALDVIGYGLVGTPIPTATPTATPITPEDRGFAPPDPNTSKCEDTVAKHLKTLEGCLTTCQIKQADSARLGKSFDEEACEEGSGKPVSCRTAYNTATAGLGAHTPPICPPCLDIPAQLSLADLVTTFLDNNNGQIYCAGSTAFGGDDTGFVPPDASTGLCEDTVAKHLRTLAGCVIQCHIKQADAALKGTCFDEEACESGPGKPVSCRAAYDKTAATLLARTPPICPACLDATGQSNLADLVTAFLDSNNGQIYCAGTGQVPP